MLFFAVVILFFGLSNGIVLDCTYSIETWSGVGSTYYCYATVILANDNDQIVTGVSGNHLSGRSNNDVKGILIQFQPLDFIPQNITGFFKNIQGYRMTYMPIKIITKFDLQQFPDLRHLTLNFNDNLEVIDGDLFAFTPKVVFIDLDYNKITNVGPNLISHLNVSELRFYRNLCIDQVARNASETLDLTRSLAHLCPPSADMIERIIVEGDKFAGVTETGEENQNEIRTLKVRVVELERIVMEMDALNKAKDAELDISKAKLVANEMKFEKKLSQLEDKFEKLDRSCVKV
jgi:hypothetical protein